MQIQAIDSSVAVPGLARSILEHGAATLGVAKSFWMAILILLSHHVPPMQVLSVSMATTKATPAKNLDPKDTLFARFGQRLPRAFLW
jgi:hypothetical protein